MAASDAYTTRYNKITQGFERLERFFHNIIKWDTNLEENFNRVCKYITKCSRAGITFNEDKF